MASTFPTLARLQRWDEDAQPGDQIVYYTHDHGQFADNPTPGFRYIREAAEDGYTVLTQKRYGDGSLQYIATRISPLTREFLDRISPPTTVVAEREDV